MDLGYLKAALLAKLNMASRVKDLAVALIPKCFGLALNLALTNLTDTVGVLNAIAGTTDTNRLDYSGVCNLIAGTFQLPAAQALRAVSS